MKPTVAGLVLAAGASCRMGRTKALLDANGATFVSRLVATLAQGGCNPVAVVARSYRGALADEVMSGDAQLVINAAGEGGQLGSLRAGVAHLGRATQPPPAAIVFTPVDNPLVAASTVSALIHAWRSGRAPIVVPSVDGRRGHPVLFTKDVVCELFGDGLEEGARSVVAKDPGRVAEIPVSDPAVLTDIDSPSDYHALVRDADLGVAAPGQGRANGTGIAPKSPPPKPPTPALR